MDGLSLIFIDLYFPSLTPQLHCRDVTLALSENINFFAICDIIQVSSRKRIPRP